MGVNRNMYFLTAFDAQFFWHQGIKGEPLLMSVASERRSNSVGRIAYRIGKSISAGAGAIIGEELLAAYFVSMVVAETKEAGAATRCWVEGRRVWIERADQRGVSFPASKYSRLADAPQRQLESVQRRVQGRALRWEELDEDIWVDDAVHGRFPRKISPA